VIRTNSYEYRYGKWVPMERYGSKTPFVFRQLEFSRPINFFIQSSMADVIASRPIETIPEESFRGGFEVE
jgi:hypothetical protein